MPYRILGGLTAAFVVTSFELPYEGRAQGPIEQHLEEESDPAGSGVRTSPVNNQEPSTPTESNVSTANPEELSYWISSSPGLISVFPHAIDGYQAVTLYFRSAPVITFVGAELSSQEKADIWDVGIAAITDNDLISKVTTFAIRMEEFSLTESDTSQINVRWNRDGEEFVVTIADEDLIVIDEKARLPDTTQNYAEDALQITNRLRWLFGDAPPLTKIEGLPESTPVPVPQVAAVFTGYASWYGPGFHGRRSASGEVFNQNALTAAHRTLPFGTMVRVTNLFNNRQVVVRINDRGPFIAGRVIDLSVGAASTLGLTQVGVAQVRLEVLSSP